MIALRLAEGGRWASIRRYFGWDFRGSYPGLPHGRWKVNRLFASNLAFMVPFKIVPVI